MYSGINQEKADCRTVFVARFLARLVRRHEPGRAELLALLDGVKVGTDLSPFDALIDYRENHRKPNLPHCVAATVRTNYTRAWLTRACDLCSDRVAPMGQRQKLRELMTQRRDFLETFIY